MFQIEFASDATLAGMTIQNGYSDWGGAVTCIESAVTLKDLKITNNTAGAGGGGVHGYNASLDIDNVTFLGNHSYNFAGGLLAGRSADFNGPVTTISITNSLFEGNTADSTIGGAYLYGYDLDSVNVTISNTVFRGNSSPYYSGLRVQGVSALIEDCVFELNEADRYGAAGVFSSGASATVSRTLVLNNAADLAGEGHNSGGFSVWNGANVNFDRCTFVGNSAGTGSETTCGPADIDTPAPASCFPTALNKRVRR